MILAFNGLPKKTSGGKPSDPASLLAAEEVVRPFVEHWGGMARAWGINSTMGELFALLYLTGEDWDAETLRTSLGVSRGNVSMNLRELIAWGVVHKVNHLGERREFYRAEGDVWTLFQRILTERKRRELDPTLEVLEHSVRSGAVGQEHSLMHDRLIEIQRFFTLIDAVANQVLALKAEEIESLTQLLDQENPARIPSRKIS